MLPIPTLLRNSASASLAALSIASAHSLTLSDLWINEFHYDNAGADVNEFVEVAGLAGTDLSDFSIVLYNGNNQEAYETSFLSGILANDGSGFGFLSLSVSGIQNGAPDGLALFSASLGLVQFLSYEGGFVAADGVAAGLASTDIGLAQTASPLGYSLQLVGTGSTYSDFQWALQDSSSPGSINSGQSLVKPSKAEGSSRSVPDTGQTVTLLAAACGGLWILRRLSPLAMNPTS